MRKSKLLALLLSVIFLLTFLPGFQVGITLQALTQTTEKSSPNEVSEGPYLAEKPDWLPCNIPADPMSPLNLPPPETPQALTKEQRLEDFEVLFNAISSDYPYLNLIHRVHGLDWVGQYELFKKQVSDAPDDEAFATVLADILYSLNNWHTGLASAREISSIQDNYVDYVGTPSIYEEFIALNSQVVRNCYSLGGGQPRSLEYDPVEQGPQDPVSDNVQVGDLVEGKVAYINIPEMLGEQTRSIDEQKIDAYLSQVKDYPALILDIRGNPGGFDEYWRDMLLPKIVPETFSTTQYLLFRDGETSKTLRSEYEAEPISELANESMTFAHPEDWQDFESYVKEMVEVKPAKDSIKFKGKIFLFADEGTYSSAEAMASFAKTSGLATVIGKVTAGGGITPGVLYRVLPNSGLVYTYTNALGYAGDGTINEETRTVPHILSDNPEIEVLNHLEEDLVETAA